MGEEGWMVGVGGWEVVGRWRCRGAIVGGDVCGEQELRLWGLEESVEVIGGETRQRYRRGREGVCSHVCGLRDGDGDCVNAGTWEWIA